MTSIRIAIDPRLVEKKGPEIHWTWRLLLTGMGWSWKEVSLAGECDIAFVLEPSDAPHARLCIQADPQAWGRSVIPRLLSVQSQNGLTHPAFSRNGISHNPIHVEEGRVLSRRDLIFDVFWMVTGQEERFWPQQDHGFYNLTGTRILQEQLFHRALASHIGAWLRNTLIRLGCPPPTPPWPGGKRAAVSISHDVDYPEVVRWLEPLRIVARLGRQGIRPALSILTGQRDHWQFAAWVELEKELHTHSAFYFVARKGSLLEYATGTPDPFYDISSKRFRELFRELRHHGVEIGLHASYLAYRDKEQFAAEKQRLEELIDRPVLGNRHHYWHLNPANAEETLLMHEQIGFKYDSSLIHDHYLGWRRGISQPFFPFHQGERRELKTLQIPATWMDDQLFGMHKYNPGDRLELLCALADRAIKHGGAFLIDIHDYVFDDALFPGWVQTMRQLLEHMKASGAYWFAAPWEIAQHWTERYRTLVSESNGLREGLA